MTRHVVAIAVAVCLSPSWLPAQTAQTFRLTVNTASAAIHKGPSTGSPVVGKAPRGASVEVTRDLGDWVRISWPDASDGTGYVHRSLLSPARGVATRPPGAASPSAVRPAPASPASSAPVRNAEPVAARGQAGASRPVHYIAPPTHFVGVGGRISGSTLGYGVSGRAWSRDAFGLQVDLSRAAQTGVALPGRMTSVQFAPSVLYSLRDRMTDYVRLRPYVGGGASFNRVSLELLPGAGPAATDSRFGFRGFGGVEMTFASAPRFTLSADAGYDSSKTPWDGFTLGGIGFGVSGHWYFK